LNGELLTRWKLLLDRTRSSQVIEIPRYYFAGVMGEIRSYELCGFCDASAKAYAAVVYLLARTESATNVVLLCSKIRVAPIHLQSIPRLKLLSALLLARLISNVADALGRDSIMHISCYTDSKVSLY
jgi:hypothetical protein